MTQRTTEEWVAAEIAEIEARNPANRIPAPDGITEEAIAEKVALGITRKQAIQVLTNQAENDARLNAEKLKSEKPKGK
jgi:hypothetical protein